MIISYLLGISFIVISTFSFCKIFIKEDREITKIENSFIKKTKNSLSSQRGSISLVGASFCLILTFFILFLANKMRVEFYEAKYRKESYLCFHYLNGQTTKYVKEMGHFNKVLLASTLAMAFPPTTAKAKIVHDATKWTRNLRHIFYLTTFRSNEYCSNTLENLVYLKNWPFKLNKTFLLKENFDGSSIVRKEKWSVSYRKLPKRIRLKKSFALKASFELNDPYLPTLRLQTQEI